MRRGLITLLTAALLLTCALPAEAAKRKVPRGFYGVMWNRAAAAVPEELHEAQFARMARAGVESVRTVFYWSAAQPVAGSRPTSPPPTTWWAWPRPAASTCSPW